jgi:hypothetical protein
MDITHQRTAHLIDLENLVGSGLFSLPEAVAGRQCYQDLGLIGRGDHVIVACNPLLVSALGHPWPGTRLLVGHGPDGADRRLLTALETERLEARFDRIVLASGDGIFADSVARLRGAGCDVLVVGREGSIARRLRLAVGHNVVEVARHTPLFPPAAQQLAVAA